MSIDVKVTLWERRDGDKALAAGFVTIADTVKLNFSVFNGKNGPFVSYPSYKKADGTWQETAGPVNKDARDLIGSKIIEAMNNSGSQPKAEAAPAKVESGPANGMGTPF